LATKKTSAKGSTRKKSAGSAEKTASPPGKKTKATSRQRPLPGPGSATSDSAGSIPVVGIGASAGGLEAFIELVKHLPVDTGMALVFIQHYKPGQPSMLAEILGRETSMKVENVRDGQRLQPNHVYVHASYDPISLRDGVLIVKPEGESRGERHMPIDHFLESLAEIEGSQAIGVVLSGTASDGTVGMKAIKAAGGITLVQDTESARYDGMPASAIAAGAATLVLPPAKLAEELARIAHHPFLREPAAAEAGGPPQDEGPLRQIFTLLRKRFGVDFTYYKQSTILRRVRRRMVVQHQESIAQYLNYLSQYPDEQQALYQDMLINVTAFFRDPETFKVMSDKLLPGLLKDRNPEYPLRVWVPGCSTGEEVYSIAITVLEFLESAQQLQFPVQIFATDVDDHAIAIARAGIYTENVVQTLSEEQLRRHFVKVPQGYQISKQLRDMCVFSRHNVIKDPPFSRLDFISCRNLLIYLGPVLQKKLMPLFHFALKPNGYLILGSAESIGAAANLFEIVDKKVKIYSKKSVETPVEFEFRPPRAEQPAYVPFAHGVDQGTTRSAFNLHQATNELLVREYGPPTVVIDEDMQIVEFRGHTGRFLEPAPGEASFNLLKMAREGLVAELRAAVIQAIDSQTRVHKEHLRAGVRDTDRRVALEVIPIHDGDGHYYMVVFNEEAPAPPVVPEAPAEGGETAPRPAEELEQEVRMLEQELASTKEYLHSVIERQELTNEDLRCANEEVQSSYEELQSSNEELQSTNEELETAKEELQSSNEELRTVNEELESRNAELTTANNDLFNLIASVDMAIAMVGTDLRIRRFSPKAQHLLNLIETDIGRPISNIKTRVQIEELEAKIRRTADTFQAQEEEVQDDKGNWYLMRIHPYRTMDNRIEGAVLVFLDIDRLKRSLDENRRAREYAEAVITAVRQPLLVLDPELRVVSASNAYLDLFRASDKDTLGNRINHLGDGQWAIPQLQQRLEAVLEQGEDFTDFEVEMDFDKIGRRQVRVSGTRVAPGQTREALILMQIEPQGQA
jgi:two-component system CheB/CheR fusion protein